MQPSIEIAYRSVPPSAAFEKKLYEHIETLQKIFQPIQSIRAVLNTSRKRGRSHLLYDLRLEIGVPGKKLTVGIDSNNNRLQDYDPYQAMGHSFKALEKRLRRYRAKTRRSEGRRRHEAPPKAVVERVFQRDGYGFLRAETGEQVYFHENSVLKDDFSRLRINDKVRFAAEQGDKGPQASTVELLSHEAA